MDALATTSPSPPTTPPTQIYTTAVLLGLASLLLILLITPPLIWHFRNRNIGATSLVAWIIVLLSSTFLNALIWPSDNTAAWFSGRGLCDVEVKIQYATQVALPASFAAVLRGLAKVLDTDHASVMLTKAQRRRNAVVDLLFCVGAPALQMVLHELVHFRRYAIYGIAGCVPVVHNSWLTLLFLAIPLLWAVIDAVYAVLILLRLLRYRKHFTAMLATSNTTTSRFLRLYLICVLWILGFLPISVFLIARNAGYARKHFSWTETHDHAAYHAIFKVQSHGSVLMDRWIWISVGVCVFVFFGCGREAMAMYRQGLLALGLGRVFPSLKQDHRRGPLVSTFSSVSSKARLLFKRKGSTTTSSRGTWTSASSGSGTTAVALYDPPISPKTTTFLPPAIHELDIEKAATPSTSTSSPSNNKPSQHSSPASTPSSTPRSASAAPPLCHWRSWRAPSARRSSRRFLRDNRDRRR